MAIRLSIIIPGYNTPDAWWSRCIESVLAACGPDDEIICVDDGSACRPKVEKVGGISPEGEARAAKQALAVCGQRIKWIYLEKNEGQSAARNHALEVAQGEWVTFVDSDDEIVPGIYDRCFKAMEGVDCDLVAFGMRAVYCNDGLMVESVLPERNYGRLSPADLKAIVEARLFDEPVNKLYRRLFLDEHKIRFPENICPGEDAMFVLQNILCGARWISVSGVGYIYYRMDGTTLSRYFPNYEATLRYWKRKWDEYLAGPGRGYDGWLPTAGFSEKWVAGAQWNNIWKRGSPLSLRTRWQYLRAHPEVCRNGAVLTYLKKAIYTFLRLHFYIRPIRRWHLKRLRPDAREWSEKKGALK